MSIYQKGSPLVSVVIPTFNSMPFIKACVASVLNQVYKNWELIIVDGGSKDGTIEVSKSSGAHVYVINGIGMAEATNYGAAKAKGKYIYRVDSDVVLSPTIIQECVDACEKKGYDAIGVLWLPDPSISFWARVRRLEKESYRYDHSRLSARFVKKSLFEKVNGYNLKLTAGEDYDFYNRIVAIGARVGKIDSEERHMGEPKKLSDVVKKNYKYGKTISVFLNQRNANFIQVNPIRLSIIFNIKNFIKDPLAFVAFPIYYFVLYSSALIGFLASKI